MSFPLPGHRVQHRLLPCCHPHRCSELLLCAFPGLGISGVGLSGFGLSGVGLSGPGLSGFGLSGVGLSGPGLSGFGLSGVGLSGPGFSGSGLSGSDLAYPGLDYLLSRFPTTTFLAGIVNSPFSTASLISPSSCAPAREGISFAIYL